MVHSQKLNHGEALIILENPSLICSKESGYGLSLDTKVKIVTARAQNPEEAIPPIKQWLTKHGLPDLEVTNCKDMDMIELWDDRCVQVVPNTGNPIGPNPEPYRRT